MIFFEILAKMANFAKDEKENFKCQIFDWKHFIFDFLKGAENRFSIYLFAPQNKTNNQHMGKTIG